MPDRDKIYNLEDRTYKFALDFCVYLKRFPKTLSNIEHGKQGIRSTGSVGANYIEANEALGKKDFQMHVRISRKEAKESAFWIRLPADLNGPEYKEEGRRLFNEAQELKKIFSSMLQS